MKKLNKKGFTLTEMIVVIAIIGILAAVLIPSVVIYVNRAKESNDNQLAASMSDEIERYCIESNIDQKNLKASDVRSILIGKGYDLAPSRKVYTYVYNVSDKIVEVIRLDDISDNITISESDEPAEYADGMYIIGKGKSDFEQCINDLYNGVFDNLSEYDIEGSQADLLAKFLSNTLYVQNNAVIKPATHTFAGEDAISNIVFCEMVFNVPAQLAEYASQISSEFSVPEIICTIDASAKAALNDKISNMNSIRSFIKCLTLGKESFDVNTYTFTVGSYIENTVAQTFELDTLGIYTDSTTGERYYVRQVNASFYSLDGLSAKGSIAFLEICVKEDALIRDLTPVSASELEALGIK